jgi:hypothetical protein
MRFAAAGPFRMTATRPLCGTALCGQDRLPYPVASPAARAPLGGVCRVYRRFQTEILFGFAHFQKYLESSR